MEVAAPPDRSGASEPSDPRTGKIKRAVVLGAGVGTALCPLSTLRPRYLWPLANRPALVNLLGALRRQRICNVDLVCAHRFTASQINGLQKFAGDHQIDLNVMFDSGQAGSAGLLRYMRQSEHDDPVLVLSANLLLSSPVDAIRDLNLAWRAHGTAAVLTMRSDRPTAIERMEIGDDHWIRAISLDRQRGVGPRDPSWTSGGAWVLKSSMFNCIPDDGYYSLREQMLPELLRRGERLRAVPVHRDDHPFAGAAAYLQLNDTTLRGLNSSDSVAGYARQRDSVWIAPSAFVAESAVLSGPIIIGERCRVEDEVTIEGPSSIGDDCLVQRGSVIRGSVLWNGVRVAARSNLKNSILTDHVAVPAGGRVENQVIVSRKVSRADRSLMQFSRPEQWPLVIERLRRPARPLRQRLWRHRGAEAMKRTLDMVLAATALVATSPLLLAAAVAIKLESPGPVFFRQQRCTRNGVPFAMLKLRSMVNNAEQLQDRLRDANEVDGPMFKMERDPRITRVGAILRKTSLDEVPQMVNVLRGEMSLVGPRPLAEHEMTMAPFWRDLRLAVKPGVTGLWQLHGRRQHAFSDWIVYDIEYVKNRSLTLDFKILLGTAFMVVQSLKPQRDGPEARPDKPREPTSSAAQ